MAAQAAKRRRALVQPVAAVTNLEPDPERYLAPGVRVEHELLQRCRRYPILEHLRVAARTTRAAQFQGDISTLVNMVRMSMSDILHRFLQGHSEEAIRWRHQDTADMLQLVVEVCKQPTVLTGWKYSGEQCEWARERLGILCGAEKQFTAVSGGPRPVLQLEDKATEAPFITSLLYLLISPEFDVIRLSSILSRARAGRWNTGPNARTWFIPLSVAPRFPEVAFRTEHDQDMGVVTVWMRGEHITAIHFSEAWPEKSWHTGSHWLPEECRLELAGRPKPHQHMLKVPSTDAAYLSFGKRNWEQSLGSLSAELQTILDGNYVISKSKQIIRPGFQKNHPSWENYPDRQAKLWPEIAKMLWKGILEYVSRHCRLPLRIIAVGAVPKATEPLWRLIMDCRPINEFVDPWRVKYVSLKSLSLILQRNCIFWIIDLSAAYFNTSLGGCGRPYLEVTRWILSQDQNSYVPMKTRIYGCTPETCGGFCDKATMGIYIGGHFFRLANCPFGHATSNGPLSVLTDAVLRQMSQRRRVDGSCYVDDFLFLVTPATHQICDGLENGCPVCVAALPKAKREQKFTCDMMDNWHLRRSSKGADVGQVGEYIGVIVDSHRGKYQLTERKEAKLVKGMQEALTWTRCTPRTMSGLHGKLVNYSFCIQRIRPFAVPLRKFVGSPMTKEEWDTPKSGMEDVHRVVTYLLPKLHELVQLGAPIWPREASTLLHEWQQGVSELPSLWVIRYDASVHGIAMTFQDDPDCVRHCVGRTFERVSTVLTFEEDLQIQAHREAWAGPIALEVFIEQRPPPGTVVIFVNDCAPALTALKKGSNKPRMQKASEQLHEMCIENALFPLFLHVAGEALVEDGTDDGSRAKARSLQGPACAENLWRKITAFAAEGGRKWSPTIDMFAAACNRRLKRFCAWTPELGCEQVDAFAARSWDTSRCPGCGQWHRECGFYFPPNGLADTVVRRARSDGAKGLFLVPTNHKAGYFIALRAAAVQIMEIETDQTLYRFTNKPVGRMTLFAAEFGRPEADRWPAPCAQAFEPRIGRQQSEQEAVVTHALKVKLSALER